MEAPSGAFVILSWMTAAPQFIGHYSERRKEIRQATLSSVSATACDGQAWRMQPEVEDRPFEEGFELADPFAVFADGTIADEFAVHQKGLRRRKPCAA